MDDRPGAGQKRRRGGRGNGRPMGDGRRALGLADRLGPQGGVVKSAVVSVTVDPPVDREKVRARVGLMRVWNLISVKYEMHGSSLVLAELTVGKTPCLLCRPARSCSGCFPR